MAQGPDLRGIEWVVGFAGLGVLSIACGVVYGISWLVEHVRWYVVP